VVFSTVLNAPSGLQAPVNVPGSVILVWSDTSTAGATGFTLQRCTGNATACNSTTGTFATVANTPVTVLTFTNRTTPVGNPISTVANTVYTYRVQATGPAGLVSAFSNYLTLTAH
jgi:hypothetical protein